MEDEFKAPAFTWQLLRSTCATYLTGSTGIGGAATVFLSARQFRHSVAVAKKHYLGTHRGVPREAKTLEAAMGTILIDSMKQQRNPNNRWVWRQGKTLAVSDT
jgi:hypothetical protein